jgi:hypothetical protein
MFRAIWRFLFVPTQATITQTEEPEMATVKYVKSADKIDFTIGTTEPITIPLSVPAEYMPMAEGAAMFVVEQSAKPNFNIGKFIAALFGLVAALSSKDPIAIAQAFAALLAAITGP